VAVMSSIGQTLSAGGDPQWRSDAGSHPRRRRLGTVQRLDHGRVARRPLGRRFVGSTVALVVGRMERAVLTVPEVTKRGRVPTAELRQA
jgi:hypothetical protein